MNISTDTFYNLDEFAKIIAKNENKVLFLMYNQDKNSSYYIDNIMFHNFTTNENFCKQIIKSIKYFYGSCIDTYELFNDKNQMEIRLFGASIEIFNIPTDISINEIKINEYIKNNY